MLKDAENKDEAEEWINFLCSTDASLKNMDYIWYASPNAEALETILPTMRRPTESPWIPLSMRSWPPPRRCWTGVRPTWSSLLRRAPSITTSGRNSVSEL